MATKEIKITTCDVCSSELTDISNSLLRSSVTVVFTTEQTEGRSIKPYLSLQTMDMCPACLKTMLSGKMLFAHGAMGHNSYYFKKD